MGLYLQLIYSLYLMYSDLPAYQDRTLPCLILLSCSSGLHTNAVSYCKNIMSCIYRKLLRSNTRKNFVIILGICGAKMYC